MEETSLNSGWAFAVTILQYPDLCRTVPQFPTIPSVERVYTGFPFGKVASPIHHTNAIHTIKTISRISTLAAIATLQNPGSQRDRTDQCSSGDHHDPYDPHDLPDTSALPTTRTHCV